VLLFFEGAAYDIVYQLINIKSPNIFSDQIKQDEMVGTCTKDGGNDT
jgi:hypothetical protein